MADEHARPTREEPLTADDVPAPSHAERARTLVGGQTTGTLSTLSPDGYPHGSYVTFALDGPDPLFLVSTLATHTQHLAKDGRGSLLVHEDSHPDPLANGRVTLLGRAERIQDPARQRARYLEVHPGAAYYADFRDFSFWSLRVERVRYIGGYGRMSWVDIDGWRDATPDPLAPHAAGIVAHMNEDHADACRAYARAFTRAADAEEVEMTAVDRYGVELSVTTAKGPRPARVAFGEPVDTPEGARKALIALLRDARERLGG
ncbi:MAG: HugZ family protein [Sandaracinaceae bacterium]